MTDFVLCRHVMIEEYCHASGKNAEDVLAQWNAGKLDAMTLADETKECGQILVHEAFLDGKDPDPPPLDSFLEMQAERDGLHQLLAKLVHWQQHNGGSDSPIWEEARAELRRLTPPSGIPSLVK